MEELRGKEGSAIYYGNDLEDSARNQVINFLDLVESKSAKLRLMPDAHGGIGCVVGTTMQYTDWIFPSLVGNDIYCGMTFCEVECKPDFSLEKLDQVAHEYIPAGVGCKNDNPQEVEANLYYQLKSLCNTIGLELDKVLAQIGTLGSGNHFVELDESKEKKYLVVHSGSRNLGARTFAYFMDKAKRQSPHMPKDLNWLSGYELKEYLEFMDIIKKYADKSRQTMLERLMLHGGLNQNSDFVTSNHNYVDTEQQIIRKGATSAKKGELLWIPLNMKDGALICEGLGNPAWNYSAPHGAGRKYSRKEAKEKLSLFDFQKEMEYVYSTCISQKTLDEAPGAYKDSDYIIKSIQDTCKIITKVTPLWNFKG